ncbi:MAG: futalosine hydrolase [Bacteroidales bacterium]
MKNLLIVAATPGEVETAHGLTIDGCTISYLTTGIGVHSTAFALGAALAVSAVDVVIHVGIAGSFLPSLPVGSVVLEASDCFADLGADNRGQFISATQLGWYKEETVFQSDGILVNPCITALPQWAILSSLPVVKGITVQTVSGSSDVIARRRALFRPDIESMEGAALFYACLTRKIPFMALRAISNPVEPRNRDRWQVQSALEALRNTLMLLS